MNIFVLDIDPKLAAQYHCDKHLVKMITEHNQILGSVVHASNGIKKKSEITSDYVRKNFQKFPRRDSNDEPSPYGIGYISHPCTVWAGTSIENYEWLINLNIEMCKEYTNRYVKVHAGEAVTNWFKSNKPTLPSIGMTPFAQAMPIHHKSSDTVKSYRNYYKENKRHFAKWKNGAPEWWTVE